MHESLSIVLGAGVTGLAAGYASGSSVFEAAPEPGGICSSYYIRPGGAEVMPGRPADGEAYHFEVGGGHWIFGGDPFVLGMIESLAPVKRYARSSAVYLPDRNQYVPYPIQDHLSYLGPDFAARCLAEMAEPAHRVHTMADWLRTSFGATLCEIFFDPFHDLYTSRLFGSISPQDPYKSPVDIRKVAQGAVGRSSLAGYNAEFVYPCAGLDTLCRALADRCDIKYGKRVVRIDLPSRCVHFEDGSTLPYDRIISTLPLNKMMSLTGLATQSREDPYTSVLVLNIGAAKGPTCPPFHWVYYPRTRSGFHRVGFYSNVDPLFLPASARASQDRVSIYVEKAFAGGERPDQPTIQSYSREVVAELQQLGLISELEVLDPTWIDVAYTWSWPGSRWKQEALRLLAGQDIHQVGRYGRWIFQGIADSIRDGLMAGAAVRSYARSS